MVVETGSVNMNRQPAISKAAVIAVVFMTVIIVRAPRKVMPVIAVPALYESRAAPFGNQTAAVMAIHRNSPSPVQSVVNVHPAPGVMHVAYPAVGAGT
jgi:hypothetical protein